MFQAFLLKYAEVGVKGKNRYVFEDALVSHVKKHLRKVEGSFKVSKINGRIFVEGNDFDFDETIDALKHVFGIIGISPVQVLESREKDDILKTVVAFIDENYDKKNFSFKVDTRRADKHYPITSPEMDAAVGEAVLNAFPDVHVDVHKPDELIHVEIREKIYIYSKTIKGAGGLPLGTNGRALLLLSGGIDSPVAGYMVSRRGVELDAVYFNAPPYTSDRAKQKVIDLARTVSKWTGPIHLHIINFTDIQLYIYEKCPHDELTIIMRRYMMRIAEHIARQNDLLGLITGESIGQVASQTMKSLYCTDDATTLPVYRPLIGFDKQDIIDISENLGTYETSILPYEDCCTIFVAKHPVTKPNLNIIKASEQNLSEKIDELFKTAIDTDEVILIEDGDVETK
ncbi:MAG: tRNA 4-thiouridine(8) synthase ThiI [Lachnospiraceae bacterium]|nr:tRNA 4-thiouridine(8) synthase ThiI [Lachnospiraceae bacterium]MDN4742026.1 tRNA uracil 4-sulfurtransferase ThiI [Lachnospiraceae bacterium C1.1]